MEKTDSISLLDADSMASACEVVEAISDFGVFCDRHVKIEDMELHQAIPFKRYDCQRRVSELMIAGKWLVILKARQLGLTWLTAAWCTWNLLTKPMYRAYVLQQNRDYAKDFLRRVRFIYQNLPAWMQVPITSDSRYQLSFNHGPAEESELRVLAGNDAAGRSMTANLFVLDEASRIAYAKESRTGCEPALERAKGQVILIATSAGPWGDFYDVWQGVGKNKYTAVFLAWDEVPDRDDAWYESEAREHESEPVYMPREYPSTAQEAFERAEGRCFPNFLPDDHVRTFGEIGQAKEQAELFRAIDFGQVHAYVCLWVASWPDANPGFTVDPSCSNTIRELLSYRYATGDALGRDKPIKTDDHACDALRYLVMQFDIRGHIHIFRELYVEDSVGKGRTDLHMIDEIHHLSGWVEAGDDERDHYKPGEDAEHFVMTVADPSCGGIINLYTELDIPCMGYEKPKEVAANAQVLEGISRINMLVDGTRKIQKSYLQRARDVRKTAQIHAKGSLDDAAKREVEEASQRRDDKRRDEVNLTHRYGVLR